MTITKSVQSPSRTRMRIVDAAWRAAAEVGVAKLSLEDVAAEAGLDTGTVLELVGSTDELLLALLDDDSAQLEGVLYQLEAAALPEAERLSQFVQVALRMAGTSERAPVLKDLWAIVLGRPDLSEWAAERIRGRRTILRNWIDRVTGAELQATPSNALASALLALIDGLILHAGLDPSAFSWENVTAAVDAILGGLQEKSPVR
ncbi:MAG TPA: TetR/AcrR family transcriptional regulator [Actinomycetota bacterium]|nr:TetR/AcrR family transcriptional regulator [Actinomycetota bacterium]